MITEAPCATTNVPGTRGSALVLVDDQRSALASVLLLQEMGFSVVQRVAEGAVQQASSLSEALSTAQATGEALEQVHSSSETAAARGRESVSAAEDGMRGVAETIEAMETINHAVSSASERIAALSESGREIGAIMQTISEIAAQTNLLALNAAIEAARAGEMGRGFAVVADEVRSLAERASNAAKDIAGLIEKVQVGVDRSVEAMSTTVNDVTSGAEKARQAGSALERIVSMSRELGSEIEIMERTSAQAGTSAAASRSWSPTSAASPRRTRSSRRTSAAAATR